MHITWYPGILGIQGSAVYPTKGHTRDVHGIPGYLVSKDLQSTLPKDIHTRDVHGIPGYLVSRDLQSTPPRDILGMSMVSWDT